MAQEQRSTSDLSQRLRRSKILNVVLAAVSVFLLIVVVAQLSAGSGGTGDTSAQSQAEQSAAQTDEGQAEGTEAATGTGQGVETRDPDDPMAIGDVDAPVVLVEWTDMRCPYCALFTRDTFPTLVEEYVDTGKVRIEVRDVAYFGDQSVEAAVAARAAANQGMFFEYLDAVYQAAPESGHADLPRETLISFAEEVGIPDMTQFESDLDSEELLTEVQTSTSTAQALGVTSVPFFAVGSSAMAGAQPVDVFRQFLDEALANAQ